MKFRKCAISGRSQFQHLWPVLFKCLGGQCGFISAVVVGSDPCLRQLKRQHLQIARLSTYVAHDTDERRLTSPVEVLNAQQHNRRMTGPRQCKMSMETWSSVMQIRSLLRAAFRMSMSSAVCISISET